VRLLRGSAATLATTLEAAAARLDPGAIAPVGTQLAWE
jgi:hypothetical protein